MKTFREFILECELIEGVEPLPRDIMIRQIGKKSGAAHSKHSFRKDYRKRGVEKLEKEKTTEINKKASQIKKMKSTLRTHDPVDSRFRELENRDKGGR
jgi:hypothetical protein